MRFHITCLGLLCAAQTAMAAVTAGPENTRLVGEAWLGQAGWEPGVAVEFPLTLGGSPVLVRPELFFNEDVKIGGAVAGLFSLGIDALPQEHAFLLGPRIAHHNADDWGWEGSAMGLYTFPLFQNNARHNLELMAVLGFMEDKREDDNDLTLGGAGGVAYAWQF